MPGAFRILIWATCFLLVPAFVSARGAGEASLSPVDFSLIVKSMHYWRGFRVSDSPVSIVDVFYKNSGLQTGIWGGLGTSGGADEWKEFDYYAAYAAGGFTVSLWDIYNFANGADPYLPVAPGLSDYDPDTTRHFVDLALSYQFRGKFPLKLMASSIIYGRDRSVGSVAPYSSPDQVPLDQRKRAGENRYSAYLEAGYQAQSGPVQYYFFVGGAGAIRDVDGTSFYTPNRRGNLVNIGISVSRSVAFGSLKLPTTVVVAWNPEGDSAAIELAVKLF